MERKIWVIFVGILCWHFQQVYCINVNETFTAAEAEALDEVSLLLANRHDIRILRTQHSLEANTTILLPSQENVAWVDYIFTNQSIFYADLGNEKGQSQILRLDLSSPSSSPQRIITKGLDVVSGLACDWRNNKIYFMDLERQTIEVCELDGSLRKVLFWTDLVKPRDVTLDPDHGYMFWTDWNPEAPRIERAGMDGSMRMTIVDEGLDMPYSLTLDYSSMKLYWTDTHLNNIQCSDYSGFSRKVISVENSQQLVAISVFGPDLYWSDWFSSSIWAIRKNDGSKKRLLASYLTAPLDVRVYTPERQPVSTGPNPCAFNNGYCSGLCLLSPNQPFYSCACPTGIKADPENGTCQEFPTEFLLFAQRDSIQMISLDTEEHIAQVISDDHIEGAVAVDYDPVDQYIYWSDDVQGTIQRMKLNGSDREMVIHGGLEYPDGISIDWVSRTLYWTDTGTDQIEMSKLDGTARRVIIDEGLDEPRAIAVDPERGYLYWSDWGDPSRIERSSLDGTNRTTLVNIPGGWPNGIAIDYKEGRIMWGTAKYRKIETANMEGNNRSVIVDNTRHIFGFSLGGDYIYWTDWNTETIERAHKHTGQNREVVATFPDLMGIKAVTKDIKFVSNACAKKNGGCSHVCIYNPLEIRCLCPANMELLQMDGKTCVYPGPSLIYWADNDIRKLSLETNKGSMNVIISNAGSVGETDTDAREGRVYWSDLASKTISRAFINGTGMEIIVGVDVVEPSGISIDWMARNLYFTDAGASQIELCKLDGTSRRVLVKDRLSIPKSIVADPKNGYLFWTDWGNIPTIERSLLDGTERELIAINCPSSYLAVDSEQRRLYWVVPHDNRIESCDMSGKDKWLLVDKKIKKPTALSVFGGNILFANSRRNSIESVDKSYGTNRTVLKEEQQEVTGFSVYHPSHQPFLFDNPCAYFNGGCEVFCLVKPGETPGTLTKVCQCPLNQYLNADKKTCSDFSNYLLVAVNNVFHRIPVDSTEGSDTVLPLILPPEENIKALDFDFVHNVIYWIDSTSRSIKRGDEFSSQPEIFLDTFPGIDYFDPFDIVFEPYSRILIFTDQVSNLIGFVNVDNRNISGIIYQESDKRPRYLGLLPEKSRIYWTDAKPKAPKIMSAFLDMSDRRVLYRLFDHVSSFTVDKETRRLFWMDTVSRSIHICNVEERFRKAQILNCADMSVTLWRKQTNGPHRKFLQDFHCGTAVERNLVGRASGLTVHENDLYWIDKDSNIIGSRDIYGRGKVSVFREGIIGLSALKAVTTEMRATHPCHQGGGCSHLCVVNDDNDAQCACPKEMTLQQDGQTCEVPSRCNANEFQCTSGAITCIPAHWRCDHYSECDDGSDEVGCVDETGP
ncbi:Low-density lipoprotein receptor-related protein 6 [Holothuria leucospilota]|uniref:Low-density lipoprotein receptor-related protein 6 n=1 Tax=Holothuria leucospilota TaxID=206669 RepID=A0A9Q1BFX8_HOLLE|nr:Low-density lipoprotein receptor-related protein 6 [Holothuria leucospilota]